MKITYNNYPLEFKQPFKLSTNTRSYTDTIILRIEKDGFVGYGETSLPPYLKETKESVIGFIKKVNADKLGSYGDFNASLDYIENLSNEDFAAKAAFDMALHDLKGKQTGLSVSQLYNIEPVETIYSSYTIGISTDEELEQKLKDSAAFKIIKLKLGSDDDKKLVASYLRYSNKLFCVDVNQGWKNKEQALEMINWLHEKGVLFIEQPMPKEMTEEMQWLLSKSSVPLIADESVQRLEDLEIIANQFSGINIKLMKSGGIREAYKMISKAKELGLKVLVGCMAESSCAVTAASHLAPLADWVDLDAPYLVKNDPFNGVQIINGLVQIPTKPGLGINPNQK